MIVRKSSLEDVLAQKCLKEADVTLAEDDYSDFELRLWDEKRSTSQIAMILLSKLDRNWGFWTISDPVVSLVYSSLCVE